MSGSYALPPEAYMDLDEICGYIAQDNPDAADRVITEIFNAIPPWSVSRTRAQTPGPHRAAPSLHSGA